MSKITTLPLCKKEDNVAVEVPKVTNRDEFIKSEAAAFEDTFKKETGNTVGDDGYCIKLEGGTAKYFVIPSKMNGGKAGETKGLELAEDATPVMPNLTLEEPTDWLQVGKYVSFGVLGLSVVLWAIDRKWPNAIPAAREALATGARNLMKRSKAEASKNNPASNGAPKTEHVDKEAVEKLLQDGKLPKLATLVAVVEQGAGQSLPEREKLEKIMSLIVEYPALEGLSDGIVNKFEELNSRAVAGNQHPSGKTPEAVILDALANTTASSTPVSAEEVLAKLDAAVDAVKANSSPVDHAETIKKLESIKRLIDDPESAKDILDRLISRLEADPAQSELLEKLKALTLEAVAVDSLVSELKAVGAGSQDSNNTVRYPDLSGLLESNKQKGFPKQYEDVVKFLVAEAATKKGTPLGDGTQVLLDHIKAVKKYAEDSIKLNPKVTISLDRIVMLSLREALNNGEFKFETFADAVGPKLDKVLTTSITEEAEKAKVLEGRKNLDEKLRAEAVKRGKK